MRGAWTSFDVATTNAEFRAIPQPDRRALFYAMERYARGDEVGFEVEDYGEGLMMIKKRGPAGRCLFFTFEGDDRTRLVALLAYKKESDEAPRHLLASARERRGRYLGAAGE